jgi:hypothetical protein
MALLQVEIFYDHEVDLWGYSVPVLNLVGTGCPTRADAERLVLDSIEFALEEDIDDPHEGSEIVEFDVILRKAG